MEQSALKPDSDCREIEVLIIGAGPTGLGAAHRLAQIGHENWLVLEKSGAPGGLASSVRDEKGFTWDLGGHVVFSHYREFDDLLSRLLANQWIDHKRESWIWMKGRFIPYPLQNNIWRLPIEDRDKCLDDLRSLPTQARKPENFDEWLRSNFGQGLYDLFLKPYNFKVWAHPATEMNAEWVSERVAPVDLHKIDESIRLQKDDAHWGPNAVFRFPKEGGTGAIWNALHRTLPEQNFRFNSEFKSIDLEAKTVLCHDGSSYRFEHLISTIPLNELLEKAKNPTPHPGWSEAFRFSSSHIFGVGLKGNPPESLKRKSWMYFPEGNCPFYRVTLFSAYSPSNVPDASDHWSLLAEVSESRHRPVNSASIGEDVIEGLKNVGFLTSENVILSRWSTRLQYGYPVPFQGRDSVLKEVQSYLQSRSVLSRGRFGGWKYEVSNQDHCFMQGVEAVNAALFNEPEQVYRY